MGVLLFAIPPSIGTPRASTSTGRGVSVKQEVDSQTTTKTFPPLFFGKTPTPSGKRKTIFFFLGIPRPPDFLGQPSDSVVVPMCTLFCGPDSSGAMLDRSGRCAERKINGSTTLSRESGRSPPPSHPSSSSFSTLALTVFPEAKAAARAMSDRKNLFATLAAVARREATFYDPPSFSFFHLPGEFNTQVFGVCAPARLLNALFCPAPLSLS